MYWSVSLPSQNTQRPYGHLICTPVSCLSATSYIQSDCKTHNDVKSLFDKAYVKKMMEISHSLYSETFSKSGMQLMIQDIFPWINNDRFTLIEAAGLIITQALENEKVEDLKLTSFTSLLKECIITSQKNSQKNSIIVTTKGHTVCFMCSEIGEIFVFDPLPSSLYFVPFDLIDKKISEQFGLNFNEKNPQDIQYSAVVIQVNN